MPTIRYEKQDNIGIITINRPEALNALNTAVFNELEPLVGEIERDATLAALIIYSLYVCYQYQHPTR